MDAVKRPILRLWRALGSRSLAAVLLGALLLATVLASLFPQAPGQAAAREPWLAAATLRYGKSTGFLDALGLFDAYHTPWFLTLLAAPLLNTLVCTIQRVPRLWRSLAHPAAGPRLEAVSQATSLVSHLAAVALVVAIAARPALVTEETGVKLLPGQAHSFDQEHNLAVKTGSLAVDLYPGGQPRDYRVALALMAKGSPAVTETVRLNQPATFRGVTFYLQGYGPAAEVIAPEGTFPVALASDQSREVALPTAGVGLRLAYQPDGSGLFVEALDTSSANPTAIGSGLVGDGEQIQVRGVPITLRLTHYTIWQVGRDPTFGVAAGAAGLLLAAVLASLWLPQTLTRRRRAALGQEAILRFPAGRGSRERPCLPAGQNDSTRGQCNTAVEEERAQAEVIPRSIGSWLGAATAVVLAGLLAGQGVRAGYLPLSTERQVALAFALATALAAVAIGMAAPARGRSTVQALTLGLAVGLAAYAWLGVGTVELGGNHGGVPLLRSVWFPLHVGVAVSGYGALAMAGAAGAAWLIRLPARPAAQRLLDRAVAVGYPLLTLSMLLGMVWGQVAWGRYWNWDLKEVWTLNTWLIYTLYWHVRHRPAWQGRRLAWLAIAGLATALFAFLGVGWLARSLGVEGLRLF
jgi:ABC-type transport system involved in cytochrome c biogenesis permease subunit